MKKRCNTSTILSRRCESNLKKQPVAEKKKPKLIHMIVFISLKRWCGCWTGSQCRGSWHTATRQKKTSFARPFPFFLLSPPSCIDFSHNRAREHQGTSASFVANLSAPGPLPHEIGGVRSVSGGSPPLLRFGLSPGLRRPTRWREPLAGAGRQIHI